MELFVWEFECECGHEFVDYDLDEFNYGGFILRNASDHRRTLFAIDSQVFSEISKMTHASKFTKNLSSDVISEIPSSIFGVTCDRAEDGSVFSADKLPSCPKCGNANIEDYGQRIPVVEMDVEAPEVTHEHWNTLSLEQKKILVDEAIQEYLLKLENLSES